MRISDWSSDVCSSDLEAWRQRELLERRAVPERARLLRQHRHVVPRIVDRLIATIAPRMLGNGITLTDNDPVGIGVNLRGAAQRTGCDRVLVVIEPHEQRLGDSRSEEHTSELQSLMRRS